MNKIEIIKDAAEKAMAAEATRTEKLLGRAERLIAANVVVMGFHLLNLNNFMGPSLPVKITACAALAVLALALLFGFCALRLKGYTDYPRGDILWDGVKAETVTDETAAQAVIQLFLKTREQNARLNDTKTRLLVLCGWLFFAGLLLAAASHFIAVNTVWKPSEESM